MLIIAKKQFEGTSAGIRRKCGKKCGKVPVSAGIVFQRVNRGKKLEKCVLSAINVKNCWKN